MALAIPRPNELRDFARWLFWRPLRDRLDPKKPERLRALYRLWPSVLLTGGQQRERMKDEYRRCFGERYTDADLDALVRESYRIAFRTHLEELILGRLDERTVFDFLQLEGRENLDDALERGKGALIMSAHAGSFMLPIAAISLLGYPYTQYAARGLPPQEVLDANPDAIRQNRWANETRTIREENEDALPANYLTLHTSARTLYRRLANNETVGIAFDGRVGNKWVRMPYLGREALLNPGPYRLASKTGAAIIPTLTHTPDGGPGVCTFGEPIYPEDRRWQDLMREFVHRRVEPWLAQHPEEYGVWLAHCRGRAMVDDHPFFVDYAKDDGWQAFPKLED